MARWLEVLSQFNFSILHRKGKQHGNADGLCRTPCDPEACPCYDGQAIVEDLPCGGCDQCVKKHKQWSSFRHTDNVVPLITKSVGFSANLEQPDDGSGACQPQKGGNSAEGRGSRTPGGLQVPRLITLFSLCFVIAQYCWSRAVALLKKSAKPLGKWVPMAVLSVMGVRKGKRHPK